VSLLPPSRPDGLGGIRSDRSCGLNDAPAQRKFALYSLRVNHRVNFSLANRRQFRRIWLSLAFIGRARTNVTITQDVSRKPILIPSCHRVPIGKRGEWGRRHIEIRYDALDPASCALPSISTKNRASPIVSKSKEVRARLGAHLCWLCLCRNGANRRLT